MSPLLTAFKVGRLRLRSCLTQEHKHGTASFRQRPATRDHIASVECFVPQNSPYNLVVVVLEAGITPVGRYWQKLDLARFTFRNTPGRSLTHTQSQSHNAHSRALFVTSTSNDWQ
jgi:hypothetical protein